MGLPPMEMSKNTRGFLLELPGIIGTALSSYMLILLKILPYRALSFFFPSAIIFFEFAISALTGLFSGSILAAEFRSRSASSGRPRVICEQTALIRRQAEIEEESTTGTYGLIPKNASRRSAGLRREEFWFVCRVL